MIGGNGQREVLFAGSAPPMGYRTFWLKEGLSAQPKAPDGGNHARRTGKG